MSCKLHSTHEKGVGKNQPVMLSLTVQTRKLFNNVIDWLCEVIDLLFINAIPLSSTKLAIIFGIVFSFEKTGTGFEIYLRTNSNL